MKTLDIDIRKILRAEGGVFPLLDGHRRRACCELLGIPSVTCVVHESDDGDPADTFAILNGASKKQMDAKQWMAFWYASHGAAEKNMPHQTLGHIRICAKALGGRDGIKWLIDRGASPVAQQTATWVITRMERTPSLGKCPSLGTVIRWMVSHKTTGLMMSLFNARSATLNNKLLNKMYRRILSDLPFGHEDIV